MIKTRRFITIFNNSYFNLSMMELQKHRPISVFIQVEYLGERPSQTSLTMASLYHGHFSIITHEPTHHPARPPTPPIGDAPCLIIVGSVSIVLTISGLYGLGTSTYNETAMGTTVHNINTHDVTLLRTHNTLTRAKYTLRSYLIH